MSVDYSVVIPTVGRDNLKTLLYALGAGVGPKPSEIILVDDRSTDSQLALPPLHTPLRMARSGGRGPAAARNVGWQLAETEWIVFLDDDVITERNWASDLEQDLSLPADVAGSQAKIVVPVPGRPLTDDERRTAGLATARWITADMAYRRSVLHAVGGFDERFPRAYREDADLALRVRQEGCRLVVGRRTSLHPLRTSSLFASVRAQAGNADDALMRHKHGKRWRERIGEGRGRLTKHAITVASGLAALALARPAQTRRLALASSAAWAGLTAEFLALRVLPGPRTVGEIVRLTVSSLMIPPAACVYRLTGELKVRRGRRPAALLFDRDGTLIVDVPYLADPELVSPIPGVAEALRKIRMAGIPTGIVSNQSGVARKLITADQLAHVNARVDELLGPFQTWQVCVHAEQEGCGCRKPSPGLIRQAAHAMGVDVRDCVVIGDTAADVAAAVTAGARGILVPTARTLHSEIRSARAASQLANDMAEAVSLALHGRLR